jgi:hypothetical protein
VNTSDVRPYDYVDPKSISKNYFEGKTSKEREEYANTHYGVPGFNNERPKRSSKLTDRYIPPNDFTDRLQQQRNHKSSSKRKSTESEFDTNLGL